MGHKTLPIVSAIIAATMIFALSACAIKDKEPAGSEKIKTTMEISETESPIASPELVEAEEVFNNIGLVMSEDFYKRIPNASYDIYISKDNSESIMLKVWYTTDLYRIDYYDQDQVLKGIFFDRPTNIYQFVNYVTNTSLEISLEQLNVYERIQPHTLLTPLYHSILGYDLMLFVRQDNLDGLACKVYDVYNKDKILTKRIYISEQYKIIVRVEDLLNKVTTTVKNFIPDSVTQDIFDEIRKIPAEKNLESEVPVEGAPSGTGVDEIN